MKRHILLVLAFLATSSFLSAQEVPKYEKGPYRDSANKLFWNKSQEVFISLSPTKGGKQEVLESEVSKDYTDPFYFDTEGLNYIRTKWAIDKKRVSK